MTTPYPLPLPPNMHIKSISLQNYRNYIDSSFEFSPEGSLIIGKNGSGKTNLLEAISYFTYGKSILNHLDLQLINHGKDSFFVKSCFQKNTNCSNDFTAVDSSKSSNGFPAVDLSNNIQAMTEFKAYYNSQKKKVLHIDQKPLNKLSDLYQHLQVVYSGPDDIFNIFSVPARRRTFLDMAISKIYPVYIDYLRRFKETLAQRNSLLKKDFSKKEKEAWDRTFCEDAKNVVDIRLRFFEVYRSYFKEAYAMIMDINENVDIFLKLNVSTSSLHTLHYQSRMDYSSVERGGKGEYNQDFISYMLSILHENTEKEKKYQTSLFGPHLDDFIVSIYQKNAILFASQGQKRSLVVALKVALANMITDINNILPIMIFDDTLAELDKQRCENLLKNLTGKHQIFIASPTRDRYLELNLPVMLL